MRGWGRAGLVAIVVAIAASGCSSLAEASIESIGCTAFLSDCREPAMEVAGRHPGAREVEMTCTAAVCDRSGGQGTAVVTMPDGTRIQDTFSYTGDPAPPPDPTCRGVPLASCRDVARRTWEGMPPSRRVVAIDVRCLQGTCAAPDDPVEVTVTFANAEPMVMGTTAGVQVTR